jgi:Ca-activated chloride channel family protein
VNVLLAAIQPVLAQGEPLRSTAEGRLPLWGSLSLADPFFLALLPVAGLAFWLGRERRRRARGRISVLAPELPRTLVQRLAFLPRCLEVAGLLLAIVALARPLRGNVELTTSTEGIDIALLVDRSTSMTEEDLEAGRTRLDVVKDVVGEFARRRMTDREGAADSCALVAFARYPEMRCPFTLDVDALLGSLEKVDFADRADGGTGIGVALAKAVAVLSESPAKSRVVVLLTDGENNIDVIMPLDAANLAAEKGIRVYTVLAARYASNPFGRLVSGAEIDTTELETIASTTGGRFFRARDRAGLEATYAEIERLERTPRTEKRWAEHYDLYARLLVPAFALYALAWLSAWTWARRLP